MSISYNENISYDAVDVLYNGVAQETVVTNTVKRNKNGGGRSTEYKIRDQRKESVIRVESVLDKLNEKEFHDRLNVIESHLEDNPLYVKVADFSLKEIVVEAFLNSTINDSNSISVTAELIIKSGTTNEQN